MRKRGDSGYTMVEVMVAMGIIIVGFIGLLSLQVKTLRGATSSLTLTQAMNLAEHTMSSFEVEALSWTSTTVNTAALPRLSANGFLNAPSAGDTTGWLKVFPEGSGDLRVGPMGEGIALADVDLDAGILTEMGTNLHRKFCVHYRLTWVDPNESFRAEVRVAWARDESDFTPYLECPPDMANDLRAVSQFTLPTMVVRNRNTGAF